MESQPPISLSLGEIVSRLGGELLGDPGILVSRVATLEKATTGSIAFFANPLYVDQLGVTRAGAVIVGPQFRDAVQRPRIVTSNPYAYFARVSALLNPGPETSPGIHPAAVVDAGAILGQDVRIGPGAVIEAGVSIGAGCSVGANTCLGRGVSLGEGSVIYPNVTVYHGCTLGKRTIVHAGVVIGADGFGIAMDEGRWVKVPQIGGVVIGDDVEIGANTTIDRGAMDDTVIEEGVKLDNQIQIGHNVHIGAHTAIAACAGVAGSARIGKFCRIGGASGINGHITIADHVEISAHTLITKSINEPGTYSGAYPFSSNREWRRGAVGLRNIGELAARVRALEQELQPGKKGKS